MPLKFNNNTELGAVIDRTKDTRCITICIAIRVFPYRNTLFGVSLHPYLFAYGNMIRYDPTLVDFTSNFFVLCTNVKVYLYNYS